MTGQLQIFVDGVLNASALGPTGNVSYNPARPLSINCPSQGGTCINERYIVLGAEKHDFDPSTYPSYDGWLDELRISNIIRYSTNFAIPANEFILDANTMGLFHFNSGSGTNIIDASSVANGILIPHPNSNNEPWSSESPFQFLSIDKFDWNYDLSEDKIYFYTQPGLQDEEDLLFEKLDSTSREWILHEVTPLFKGFRNNFWQIGYEQDLFPETYYRLARINKLGREYKGEIKHIQYHIKGSEINYFPNPVKDLLTITGGTDISSVDIWTTNGVLIYSLHSDLGFERTSIDFSKFTSGLYKLVIGRKPGDELSVYTILKE